MHELSIAQGVVDTIVDRTGPVKVTAVRLVIGRLSGVVPDSVRFCFDLVAAGTPVEGARLHIAEPPGRARCRQCEGEFETDDRLAFCACGSVDVEVIGGDHLLIEAVEIESVEAV